jgi:hypothetical protein
MNAETRTPIDAFLDAVDLALLKSRTPRNTRAAIVADLESHILDALRERTADREPSPADVAQILATLGPPEAYAAGISAAAEPPRARSRRTLAPHLPTGAMLLGAGLVGLIVLTNCPESRVRNPSEFLLYLIAGTPVILMIVLASFLGLVAFRAVQREPHRYWGRFFAVIEISALPLLLLIASPMLFFTLAFTLGLLYVADRFYNLRGTARQMLART